MQHLLQLQFPTTETSATTAISTFAITVTSAIIELLLPLLSSPWMPNCTFLQGNWLSNNMLIMLQLKKVLMLMHVYFVPLAILAKCSEHNC